MGKRDEAVSDECLAALRAASEVIGERCNIKTQGIVERDKKWKRGDPCWDVMDAITAVIDALVVDKTLKLSVEDHGFEVIKMQPENKEFTCFGTGKSYIGPDTWVVEPYQIKSETDIEFIKRELKRAIDAQKENLIKEANMLVRYSSPPLKISDFKVGGIRLGRFIETGFREGEIRYDITAKIKQRAAGFNGGKK